MRGTLLVNAQFYAHLGVGVCAEIWRDVSARVSEKRWEILLVLAVVSAFAALALFLEWYINRPVKKEPLPFSDASLVLLSQERMVQYRSPIRKAMAVVVTYELSNDPELAAQCEDCRALAALCIPPELFEPLLQELDSNIDENTSTEHKCPFNGTSVVPLLVAKYMVLVERAIARSYAAKAVPEGGKANVSKTFKQHDRKHYVTGGKFVSNKALFSDDDYDRMLEKLERGQFNEAVNDYLETTGAMFNPNDFEEGTTGEMHGHDMAAHGRRVRAAEDRLMHIAQRAGVSSREFWENVPSSMRHRDYPEGLPHMRAQALRAVAQAQGPRVMWDEEHLEQVTPEGIARLMRECETSQVLHRARTLEAAAKGAKHRDEEMSPEASPNMGTGEPPAVVPKPTYVEASTQSALQSQRQGKSKHKAIKLAPEGSVSSSTAYDCDACVAAVQFSDGRLMQGYLMKRESNYIWFVTGRHKVTVGTNNVMGVEDGFAGPFSQENVKLIRPQQSELEVIVMDRRTAGGDRVCLRLAGAIAGVPPARVARAVSGAPVSAKYWCGLTHRWMHVVGTVKMVTDTAVAYGMSTVAGTCRMPIFDSHGRIVAGHYFPFVSTTSGTYPAGEVECGDLPDAWVDDYKPPPMKPQGGVTGLLGVRGPVLRTEGHKVYGLRDDADLKLYKAEFHMAKPSTAMLHKELGKYFDPLTCAIDQETLRVALAATLMLETDGRSAVHPPTYEDFELELRGLDNERTNAGSDGFGTTHHEFIVEMGEGDPELGILRVAKRAYHLWECITKRAVPDPTDLEDLQLLRMWCVQGKRDGYKYKKLYVGRSIQAPSLTFKLMYRVQLAKADSQWISREFMFRAGYDMDMPVPDRLADLYSGTLASLGLDESAFDRKMPAEFMQAYFNGYLPYMCPGVDPNYAKFLADATINSFLVLTDGSIYRKDRGNPSGFPNTLRLNCVVQLMAWCYAMCIRLKELGCPCDAETIASIFSEDIFLEICGDDSRANVLSPFGATLLDSRNGWKDWLDIWSRALPWEVKIEGAVEFQHEIDVQGRVHFSEPFEVRMMRMPPLVARRLFVADDILWAPLWNAPRCVRRLMSEEGNKSLGPLGRSEAEEEVLRLSAFMSLKLVVDWHLRGLIFSPTVQCMIDNGWLTRELRTLVESSVAHCWLQAATRRRPASWYH